MTSGRAPAVAVKAGAVLAVAVLGLGATPGAARSASSSDDQHRHGYTVAAHDPPLCTTRFCVHWVTSTVDAPSGADGDGDGVPEEVEGIAAELERTYDQQTSAAGLGWREPPRDGTVGGARDKIDAYVKSGPFKGRTWTDGPGTAGRSQPAYMLVAPELPRDVMRYVVAHEFAHVVQYGYDVSAPHWLFEATATWIEGKVVPELGSWQRHLDAWVRQTESSPFTGGPKSYGSAVWLHWLDGRYGASVVRDIWERLLSTAPETGDLEAIDQVLSERGGQGLPEEFGRFAAGLAEWRLPGSGFPSPETLPDVERRGTLSPGAPAQRIALEHGSFALLDVPRGGPDGYRLDARLSEGLAGTVALVGRIGGRTVTALTQLPAGGPGSVSLPPAPYDRVTSVLVDALPYTVEPEPPDPEARITVLPGPPAGSPVAPPGAPAASTLPGPAFSAPCCGVPARRIGRRPGRVSRLEARRRGGRVTLTWRAAPGARSYRVVVRDGRRVVRRTTRGRRLVLRVRSRRPRVAVVAVNAAGPGAAVRTTVRR